jgi:hypothetical protein
MMPSQIGLPFLMNDRRTLPWRALQGRPRVAAALLVLVTLTACSDEPEGNTADSAAMLAGSLAEAEAAGADQSQIDALEGDTVDFATYQAAMNRAMSCMSDAGLEVTNVETARRHGQDQVMYNWSAGTMDESEALTTADDCYLRYAQYVDQFWQSGTVATLDYDDRRADALRDPLYDCLVGIDADVAADASAAELVGTAAQLTTDDPSSDCLTIVAWDTWEG